ncbi:hypothetical protein [Rhodoferax sp.]|uniref:hypothetical protein n=1 Tax=Rhodoferax sp. TaxID=50421 RepID=UPI00374DDE60
MSLPAEYSIWLRPAAADEAALVQTIARLADLRRGQRFAPHVTVQGDLAQPLEGLRGMLAPLARKIPVQRWRVEAVETSPHFFRCMVLRFAPCAAFKGMQAAAQAFSQTEQGLSPFPHLSLAYGEPHPDNTRLCQELATEFVGREIVLDRLSICHSSKSVPIPDWAYQTDYPLSG